MPFWGKRKEGVHGGNEEKDDVYLRRYCKYIGSFAVTISRTENRQVFVNEKLAEFKNSKKGIRVVLQVTSAGIKTLDENEKFVKMAHSITRIAFSTCSLDNCLFAYVGRSAQKSLGYHLQAHVFRCKKQIHAQELAALVSKAFRVAFTKSTMNREITSQEFEKEVAKERAESKPVGRRWAKQELARGHELSEHAERAKQRSNSPLTPRWRSFDSFGANEEKESRASPISPASPSRDRVLSMNVENGSDSPPELPPRNSSGRDRRALECRHSYPISPQMNNIHKFSDPSPIRDPQSPFNTSEERGITSLEYAVVTKRKTDADISAVENSSDKKLTPEPARVSSPVLLSGGITDADVLQESEWYQGGLSREIAEEILQGELPGSFLVRDSHSQPGFYALSIRVPNHVKSDGISNYLIAKGSNGSYKIMGFERAFASLPHLVAFYSQNEVDLPVKLKLASNNLLFDQEEVSDEEDGDPDYVEYDNCESILQELERQKVR